MPPVLVTQLLLNDSVGINLLLAESAAGQQLALSKGPFTVQVDDPNNTVAVTAGSPDQTTPTNFKPNGTGNVGTVTVTVTDTSVTPNALVGKGSFNVVAPAPPPPPPPPVPDTLTVAFTPATAPIVQAAPAAQPVAAAPAAAATVGETGDHGAVGNLGSNQPSPKT